MDHRPGGHGNLGPIANQILEFLVGNLKAGAAAPEFRQFRPPDADDLTVTPSGQISISLNSKTVESLNRERAMQRTLQAEVRQTAVITALPGAPPPVAVAKEEQREGYRVQTLSMQSEPGMELSMIQAIPYGSGRRPAIVVMDEVPADRTAAGADFVRLAKSGHIVVVLQSRGTPNRFSKRGAERAIYPIRPRTLYGREPAGDHRGQDLDRDAHR